MPLVIDLDLIAFALRNRSFHNTITRTMQKCKEAVVNAK